MFQIIKDTLPNFPDEVIRVWLLPLAAGGYSWPPKKDLGKWRYALCRKSLDYWGKVTWELQERSLTVETLNGDGQYTVNQLLCAYLMDERNLFSNIENGVERFQRVLGYIQEHGSFPAPPITIFTNQGLQIIDGNHRIAALAAIRAYVEKATSLDLKNNNVLVPRKMHSTWVGSPPAEGSYELLAEY